MKHFLFFFFMLLGQVEGEEETKYTLYSSFENSISSFSNGESLSRTIGLGEVNHKDKYKIAGEKRGEAGLGSLEWKHPNFYASAGHRYKPIPGFYFLRDPYSYSAFQNPTHGVVHQPLNQSAFLGLSHKDWGLGVFLGKTISEKKPGIYFKTPGDILGFAYSKESETYFSSLNLREEKIPFLHSELTLSSQFYGKKEAYFGYFNSRLFSIQTGLDTRFSVYRDTKENQLNITRDNLNSINEKIGVHLKISLHHYNRIEHFTEIYKLGKSSTTGGSAALFSLPYGSLCLGGRVYEKYEVQDFNFNQVYFIKAYSVSYEWKKFYNEAMIRVENRENKDRVLEIKTTLRPNPDWRLEVSTILAKSSNQINSLYEQWSDGENINTIFTDRQAAIKLKIIGSYILLNLSGSRQKNGNEIYYGNIQFKLSF